MCQPFVQFCSATARPLLFTGAVLTLLLAAGIGWLTCTNNALYTLVDPAEAQKAALGYYLQLAASVYLVLITLLAGFAAHYDQKHSIRALALLTTVNFILALIAILLVPSSDEIAARFTPKLKEDISKYDYKAKLEPKPLEAGVPGANTAQRGPARQGEVEGQVSSQKDAAEEAKKEATSRLDSLQTNYKCCGIKDGAPEWKPLPKSCCSNPEQVDSSYVCKELDANHKYGCSTIIGQTSWHLMIGLALAALVNFYLAAVAGVSSYRTFHYNEASQSAYS